jgi:hypothetical protein
MHDDAPPLGMASVSGRSGGQEDRRTGFLIIFHEKERVLPTPHGEAQF